MTAQQRENAIELVRAANTPDAPTPETDEGFGGDLSVGLQPTVLTWDHARVFSRRLERERDALRHKLADLQSSHDAAWTRFNETDRAYQAALDRRDRYRSALETISLRHPGFGGTGDIARKAIWGRAQ